MKNVVQGSGKMLTLLWTVILVICSGFQSVRGLACYACSSLNYPDCWNGTGLTSNHVIYCNEQIASCMVRVTEIGDLKYIGRHCQPKEICEEILNIPDTIQESCSTCDTDLCNTFTSGSSAPTFYQRSSTFYSLIFLPLSIYFVNSQS